MEKTLTLLEIQKLEFEMLVAFDSVCKENNLYYTLCGGTLLGAVRHKGFIPWDDDIDVMMPRPDFNRLNSLIINKKIDLPDQLSFLTLDTIPSASIPFIKIINTKTLVSEEYMDADKHLWIDIFVSDGCPENPRLLKCMFLKQRILRWLLFSKQTRPGTGKTRIKAMIKDVIRVIVYPISNNKICKTLDKLASTYSFNECDSIGCVQWGYGPQEKVNKERWMKPIMLDFESREFPCPSNYDEYLTNLYGDYMKLPPEEKRTTHNMKAQLID